MAASSLERISWGDNDGPSYERMYGDLELVVLDRVYCKLAFDREVVPVDEELVILISERFRNTQYMCLKAAAQFN